MSVHPLPIDSSIPDIIATLRHANRVVVHAPPGAGKTTRVPAALLDAGLAGTRHIVVLEPRRVAARAAAEFVANQRGGSVGGEVGYRVRFEHRASPATRLWFETEGMFGRLLATDPFLERVGIVILDEFHERHLQGDMALAIVRELQDSVRPDLALVVMSATLETERLSAALGATVVSSHGRSYPVEIEYDDQTAADGRLSTRVAATLGRVLLPQHTTDSGGDVLVFLPGAAEIRRAALAVRVLADTHGLEVVTLHGDQPLDAQRRALCAGSQRRVILATNVAETALTVEGVTAVIDSGLARTARFDARHGINTLRIARISRAAADQRAGRAGRIAPGRCLRLWTRADHASRRPHETPEVLRLDLSRTVLELRSWGLRDPRGLRWLDAPPEPALASAERLLVQLGAVDSCSGQLTAAGRRMLAVPVPPRMAAVLVAAERIGRGEDGALVVALATEREICLEQRTFGGVGASQWATGPSDLLLRLELFEEAANRGFDAAHCHAIGLDPAAVRAVERARRQLAGLLAGPRGAAHRRKSLAVVGHTDGHHHGPSHRDALRRCLLSGFPDRVARRRAPGSPRALMVGGRSVVLSAHSVVREAELFVAVDVDGRSTGGRPEARVRLASGVEHAWLHELYPGAVKESHDIIFDWERECVIDRTRECFHDLVLAERISLAVDPIRAGQVLAAAARTAPDQALRIGDAERTLLARISFLHRWMPELHFPADPTSLVADALTVLSANRRSFAELRAASVGAVVRRALTSLQLAALEREAPTHVVLPAGRRAPVVYEPGKPPTVAGRIQELFGLVRTPQLVGGRVSMTLQILAPNQRPVQITDDLESFWRQTYPEVRKQLRGRYPKHHWPENPLTATPSSRPARSRPERR